MSVLKLESLWSATAPPGPVCSPLSGVQRAQAAVIGAGNPLILWDRAFWTLR